MFDMHMQNSFTEELLKSFVEPQPHADDIESQHFLAQQFSPK